MPGFWTVQLFDSSTFSTSFSCKLLQLRQNLGIVRLRFELINLCPRDLAVFVDDEDRAIVNKRDLMLGGRENPVISSGLRIGPTVNRQRECQPAQLSLESDVGKNRIAGDAHDLGVQVGKLGEVRLECREFLLSNRGEIEGIKCQDNVLPVAAGKLELPLRCSGGARKLEIRCRIPDLHSHTDLRR
jgi:hypothetical protein